jgi:hypothetical protein
MTSGSAASAYGFSDICVGGDVAAASFGVKKPITYPNYYWFELKELRLINRQVIRYSKEN